MISFDSFVNCKALVSKKNIGFIRVFNNTMVVFAEFFNGQ